VAIDGDTIVIGAHQWQTSGTGKAYVFRTTDGGATYGQVAKLTAADAAADDRFGWSVAIDGDTIVIGAYGAGTGGAVYILRTTDGGATYNQVAKLTAADAAAGDSFGMSVAISGDVVVAGASGDHNNRGSAYIFHTSDGGATYGQVAKLTASDAASGDYFGRSVAIDGDTVVIGASGDDSWRGAVYVFRMIGDSYSQVAKLTASDAAVDDWFGFSVAIDGGTVVIGAFGDDDAGDRSGSAYVFRTTDGGATYGQVAKLTASDDATSDRFGGSVAIAGDTVVVGSRNEAVYVYSTSVATPEPAALGSDSATRAGGTFLALLVATVLAL
jgi:hypothetical protein